MNATVSVVGASGRVGSAIVSRLARRFAVVPIARRSDEPIESIVRRAADGADLVVNAAGVAHVERPTSSDLDRLLAANVELPVALARVALARGISLVHVSSIKARDVGDESPYASSKREGDERLERQFGDEFAAAGLSLIVVRPLALLFPPFDAGKVSRLRFLRRWPSILTPALRLPVVAPATFLDAIESAVDHVADGTGPVGFSQRDFDRSERGTLRDLRSAMLTASTGGAG